MARDGVNVTAGSEPGASPAAIPRSLTELSRVRAGQWGDRLLFRYSAEGGLDGGAELTYNSLDERARALGGWLLSRGLQGQRVLLVFPPGLEFVTAFFGCLYAGSV